MEGYLEDSQRELKFKEFKCPSCHEALLVRVTSLVDGQAPDALNTGIYFVKGNRELGSDISAVTWNGLVRTFKHSTLGEFKVVKEAKGVAPWGGQIKAEINESMDVKTIIISLPHLDGRIIATLSGSLWEIWVTPGGEIHVVIPDKRSKDGYPPDQYLWLSANIRTLVRNLYK